MRYRRTQAELTAIRKAIARAVGEDAPVTLRGVFYRVVSAGMIEKSDYGYGVIERELLKMRRGEAYPPVDYEDIVDGTRDFSRPATFESAGELLEHYATGNRFKIPVWPDQGKAVYILSEKDAISGVVESVTKRWDVPLGIMRGYGSETFAYDLAQRIMDDDGEVFVYQLGDHDPSGVDAWRDFSGKVDRMAGYPDDLHFERLAVTERQVHELRLPTRPTKKSDSRSRRFKGESVEVDAIPASELRRIVEDAISSHIDREILAGTMRRVEAERAALRRLAEDYRA